VLYFLILYYVDDPLSHVSYTSNDTHDIDIFLREYPQDNS